MKNELKKAGRPKIDNPKDIKITIRVTNEENEKLEIIAKKFGIKKTELIRLFALGTDKKSPTDIFEHNISFYPFCEEWIEPFKKFEKEIGDLYEKIDETGSYYDELGNEFHITESDLYHKWSTSYNDYREKITEQNALNYFNEQYKALDIKFYEILTIEELFEDMPYILKKSSKNYKIVHQGFKIFIDGNEFNTFEEMGEYILESDPMYKDIKDLRNDPSNRVILLYGDNDNKLLKIIPYDE